MNDQLQTQTMERHKRLEKMAEAVVSMSHSEMEDAYGLLSKAEMRKAALLFVFATDLKTIDCIIKAEGTREFTTAEMAVV